LACGSGGRLRWRTHFMGNRDDFNMTSTVKRIGSVKSGRLHVFVASSLLLFAAPVFAFQHSSCYLNDCARLIRATSLQSTTDAGGLSCHSSKKKDKQEKCNSIDSSCEFQSPRTGSEKDISPAGLHVLISFLHFSDRNFDLVVKLEERLIHLITKGDPGRNSPPLYIVNKSLLI